jgi:xanthine dehydrogenase YagT iron-sulfur-binding subunit
MDDDLTRREFIGVAALASTLSVFPAADEIQQSDSSQLSGYHLTINGQRHDLALDPRVTLLDLLRERLHLTGTKKGCDHGQCGACTVIVNGRRELSCLSLAIAHDGDSITTIGGLATGDGLHATQSAFLDHDGFQCGYCTSGRRKAGPFQSAMSMLNFHINRGGKNIPARQKRVLARAKEELRKLFGRAGKGQREEGYV